MKKFILVLAMLFATSPVFAETIPNLPADAGIQKLKIGNSRFAKMQMKHPNISIEKRIQVVKGQHPFVAILSCSDSRVPTEIIFDQGIGDIFVIRNAGNVLDEHVMGSIEYAIEHLGINLVVILGHGSCGAVGAAMSEEKFSPAVESLRTSINPAICECQKGGNYTYENVIKTHAKLTADNITKDKALTECIKHRGVKVVPAFYDLSTGKVEFLK